MGIFVVWFNLVERIKAFHHPLQGVGLGNFIPNDFLTFLAFPASNSKISGFFNGFAHASS